MIVVGQKSGIAYALDPEKEGAILWQYRAGEGSIWGGIQWGAAVDGEKRLPAGVRHPHAAAGRTSRRESRDRRAGVVRAAAAAQVRAPAPAAAPR